MSLPSTQKQYRIFTNDGNVENLQLQEGAKLPQPKRGQVLIRMHAVSLNFRDIMILNGTYSAPYAGSSTGEGLVPLSDGSGEVVGLGEDVTQFQVGDKVCPIFNQKWMDGTMPHDASQCLGGGIQGVLSQYIVVEQTGLVKFPSFLSYEEAATLPCAAVTAWNSLVYGSQSVGPDQTVLVLGTGGVAVFAIQFAVAAGANVIVTSSSNDKLQQAKKFGAKHLINYRENPEWHEEVLKLTDGKGVDHVIENGGAGTFRRSLKSVRKAGQIHMVGLVSQDADESKTPIALEILISAASVRGLLVGSRHIFETMNKTIENHEIHPVINKVFEFGQAKEAYNYLKSQQHVGKIVIKID